MNLPSPVMLSGAIAETKQGEGKGAALSVSKREGKKTGQPNQLSRRV